MPIGLATGISVTKTLTAIASLHVQHVLEGERGELSRLERDVIQSMKEGELIAENVDEQLASEATLGNR